MRTRRWRGGRRRRVPLLVSAWRRKGRAHPGGAAACRFWPRRRHRLPRRPCWAKQTGPPRASDARSKPWGPVVWKEKGNRCINPRGKYGRATREVRLTLDCFCAPPWCHLMHQAVLQLVYETSPQRNKNKRHLRNPSSVPTLVEQGQQKCLDQGHLDQVMGTISYATDDVVPVERYLHISWLSCEWSVFCVAI